MDQNLAEKPSLKSHAPHADKGKLRRRTRHTLIQIPPLTPATLVNLFFAQAASRPDATQFAAKRDGVWQSWSWRKVAENASALAVALMRFQVEIGDRVALVSENRPEWGIADLAILMARGVTVPVYITNTAADHEYIFEHSGAKLVIVSNAHLAERVIEAAGKTGIRHIISFEHLPQNLQAQAESLKIAVHTLDELTSAAPDAYATLSSDPNARWRGADAQELCRLAYTSGTGGKPRGVMLSHDNIMANLEGCIERFQKVLLRPNRALPNQSVPPGQPVPERFLSFLPLSHSYEHTVGLYLAMALAAEVYYCETADRLMQYLQETQPTLVTLVPRIYELLFHRIEATLKFGPAWRRWLFGVTRKYGMMVYDRKKHLGRVANPLLTLIVRRKMRARLAAGSRPWYRAGRLYRSIWRDILMASACRYARAMVRPKPRRWSVSIPRPSRASIRWVYYCRALSAALPRMAKFACAGGWSCAVIGKTKPRLTRLCAADGCIPGMLAIWNRAIWSLPTANAISSN